MKNLIPANSGVRPFTFELYQVAHTRVLRNHELAKKETA
jgi:hypothetical protein